MVLSVRQLRSCFQCFGVFFTHLYYLFTIFFLSFFVVLPRRVLSLFFLRFRLFSRYYDRARYGGMICSSCAFVFVCFLVFLPSFSLFLSFYSRFTFCVCVSFFVCRFRFWLTWLQYSTVASSVRHVLKHRGVTGLFLGVRSSIFNVLLPFGEAITTTTATSTSIMLLVPVPVAASCHQYQYHATINNIGTNIMQCQCQHQYQYRYQYRCQIPPVRVNSSMFSVILTFTFRKALYQYNAASASHTGPVPVSCRQHHYYQ